jgi:Raf kinase inhibitor-like YbhB/YbcL family protein
LKEIIHGGSNKLMFFPFLALTTSFIISTSTFAEQSALFSLKSSAFNDKKTIPALYTCDGADRSPALAWSGAPPKTRAFVLICDDPDAPTGVWYHWVVFNLPASVSGLHEGTALPAGTLLGKNSWGRAQYNGPCPPASSIHRYHFTLYALDTRLSLPPGVSAATVLRAMQGHVIAKTTLMGIFGH